MAPSVCLTLNLLTTTIVAPLSNASKWQMGFNSAFKGLKVHATGSELIKRTKIFYVYSKKKDIHAPG